MTIRVVFHLTTNTVGTDTWEAWEFPDGTPDNVIEDVADGRAVENADMFGIYRWYDDSDGDPDSDEYDDTISGGVYPYDPEKHDGHLIFGSNSTFEWNKY